MKNLFKNITKIFLTLICIGFLVFAGKSFDNEYFSNVKNIHNNLAAVPMSWDLGKISSEIRRFEQRYNNYYFSGKDPNSSFMKRQEAALEAMRARQYDLESAQSLGYSLNTYNPKDYKLENFVSSGNPTQNVFYDPKVLNKPDESNFSDFLSSATESASEEYSPEKTNHTGTPWGGLVVGPKITCSCENPNNYIVPVNEYVSKGMVYIKYEEGKSKAYMFYDLNMGQYGLGTLDMGGICRINMGQCIDFPVYGIINSGPGFGSSGMMGGLSFPSGLGSSDFMEGGTFPGAYTF